MVCYQMTIHVCSMRYYIQGLPRSAEVLKKLNIKASAMTYTAIGEGCNKLCFFKKDHCVHICLFYKLRCVKIIKGANCTIYLYYLTKHFGLIIM